MDRAERVDRVDVVVIGGGQSGLTVAYFLKRTGLSYVVLDAEPGPGGAWRHAWDSLRLFSPSAWSSIAGWPMPAVPEETPGRDDVIDYLSRYERRYDFPIYHSTRVTRVERTEDGLQVFSANRHWEAKAVISATGTWSHPFIPTYPGQAAFEGQQLHSAHYVGPGDIREAACTGRWRWQLGSPDLRGGFKGGQGDVGDAGAADLSAR